MSDKPIKILLVEDNLEYAHLIRAMVSGVGGTGFELTHVERLSDALEHLSKGGWGVALLDLLLPDSRGLDTVVKVQAQAPNVPIVVLTGLDDEALAIKAMQEGAQDYLVKGQVDGNLLRRSIRYAIERKRAEEERRELDRMKSEFIANISHELRTPLHSIRGFTRLLLQDKVTEPEVQREFLTIVDDQSENLEKLIDNLLDASRIESGRFKVQKHRLLIKDLISEVVGSFYTIASEKGITINADITEALPEVEADGERLKQVLNNLLSNAVKFSNGSSSVTVTGEAKDDELIVRVIDQGIGIPEEVRQHLFERFYRAKDTARVGGTGLGLYISKQIIEAHGGRIWVESKVGEGSTFSFTLPLIQISGDSNE